MQCRRLLALRAIVAVIGLCMFAIAGCEKSKGPATVEVTGVVTLDGRPVEGANVLFSPGLGSNDPRLASQTTTSNDGKFYLQTHIGGGKYKSGIAPGKYDVTITKLDAGATKNTFSPPKNLLPAKYADAKTSPFKAEVVAGQANDFPLALKAE
jgi:hypothetical protein